MKAALKMIPGTHVLVEVEGAGHELLPKKNASEFATRVAREFSVFSNKL
jgi:hypothetical protein